MVTMTGSRQKYMAVMVVVLLLMLVAPASVRADTALTPLQQAIVDRVTVGLVARGFPLVPVLSLSIAMEDCIRKSTDITNCITKAATDNNIPEQVVEQSAGASGAWSVYFGVCNPQCSNYRTGKATVGLQDSNDSTFGSHLTYTQGGAADLILTPDRNGDYDFDWTNTFGQGGTGYLVWTGACLLYGFYFDKKDSTNTGIVVFRRC